MEWAAREPRSRQVETTRFCGNYDQKSMDISKKFPPLPQGLGPPSVYSADPPFCN